MCSLQQFARSLLAHVAPKVSAPVTSFRLVGCIYYVMLRQDYDVYEPKVDALGSVQGSVTFGDFVTFNEVLYRRSRPQ